MTIKKHTFKIFFFFEFQENHEWNLRLTDNSSYLSIHKFSDKSKAIYSSGIVPVKKF